MKLLVVLGFVFSFSAIFHQVGLGEEGTLSMKVKKAENKNLISISTSNSLCADSLIIHTHTEWRIALRCIDASDDCIFELNSAESAVLKKDYVEFYEVRTKGKSHFYQSTDDGFIRGELME